VYVWECKRNVISMKRVLLAAIASVFTLVGNAQQDAQFSQNMFLNNAINPGATGIKGMHCFNLVAREQWLGFEGRPETGMFNYSGIVQNFGVGAVIVYDKIGLEQNVDLKINGSYHVNVGDKGKLGLGLDLGFLQKGFSNGSMAGNPNDAIVIGLSGASDVAFDLGVGAFYYVPQKLYFGISGQKLLPQNFSLSAANPKVRPHSYITAGYCHLIPNTKIELKPNMLVKTDLSTTQLDVNLTAEFNKSFWLGSSYRVQDAIVANFGFNYYMRNNGDKSPNPLKVGIAYDFTTHRLRDEGEFTFWKDGEVNNVKENNRSFGSVELYLGYCIMPRPIREFDTYVDPLFL
jgi:type IX secretion system PorP/SprF family membrane protein